MTTKPLFENFNKVSEKEWKQKIQVDLKGADYNETLIYKSHEGIDIKPFYHADTAPTDQKRTYYPKSWHITQKIKVQDAKKGNFNAKNAIKNGAETIHFIIENENVAPDILLKNIDQNISILIETQFLSASYCENIDKIAANSQNTIFILTDIIGNLTKTGNWFQNLNSDFKLFETMVTNTKNVKNTISIDMCLFQNAGASMIQQLAYGLAQANEYLHHLSTKNLNVSEEKTIFFKMSVAGNYFFEISKIKAFRILWELVASEYKMLKKCHILITPSLRNKTILDYNMNMLRSATECMSAVLGGADFIENVPYDAVYNQENDFGTRMAINQLLILKKESYFEKMNDPASGSYYIESLTNQLVEKALHVFKNIEKSGGYLKQLKEGTIQKKIKENAGREQHLFDQEKIILTGSNAYSNPSEIMPNFQKSPFLEMKKRKTLLAPVVPMRLTEKIEKEKIMKLKL